MRLTALLLPSVLTALLWAQPQPPADPVTQAPPVFSVDVRLVSVAFSVRGPSGNLVSGLKLEDFDIFEDGVHQDIRSFWREQDSPLSLGLIIDRSGSQDGLEGQNFETAVAFIRRILRTQDQALVVGFGNNLRLLHDFTNSSRDLELALLEAGKIYDSAPRIGPAVSRNGGTAVNDVVYWTAKEKFESVPGRKALVMLGDGEENSSKLRVAVATEELQRADVLFYGLNNGGNEKRHKQPNVMPYLAEDSGGKEFRVGSGPLDDAFSQIEAELRGLYALTYHSSIPAQAGQFRKIEIKTKYQGLTVRSRPGYFEK